MSTNPESPFRAHNTVEDATQYPNGLFRSGDNWYAKVWHESGCYYKAIERPNSLSEAVTTGVKLKSSETDGDSQQLLFVSEKNLWVPLVNEPNAYAA